MEMVLNYAPKKQAWFFVSPNKVDVELERNGKTQEWTYSGGFNKRQYIYPQENDVWTLTLYYFNHRQFRYTYSFKDGKFIGLEQTSFLCQGDNHPRETTALNEVIEARG